MSITLWAAPFELFATVGSVDDEFWLKSRLSQNNNPVVADAETPAATYVSGQSNDYAIYLQAENWVGDIQAPLEIGDTGSVSLPFAPFSATLAQSSTTLDDLEFAIWWRPSATVSGAYDIEFQNFSDNLRDIDSTTPALAKLGAQTTLASGVVDPLNWVYAVDGQALVYTYVTSASATTENITLQVFSSTGAALSSPAQAAVGAPLSTVYRIAYFAGSSSFEFIESATVNGVQGFKFSSIAGSGAMGPAKFQAVPLGDGETGSDPVVIDSVELSPLKNGDILELVGYRDTVNAADYQGIETRLLNSSFDDISASTTGFVSGGFEGAGQATPAHSAVATLSNGDTILIYTLNAVVTIEQFDANGNFDGSYEFLAPPSAQTGLPPNDFDSIVAMGSRFEVTYRRTYTSGLNSQTSSEVFAVIYDTATKGDSITIDDNVNPDGLWVGTPFDDTVTYGSGVNEINGGGGTDTFVATEFTTSEVSIAVNANKQVVFTVDAEDVDTLERFSVITLADASVAIDDDTLTTTSNDGAYSVSTFNITGEPFTRQVFAYAASGQILSQLYEGVTGDGSLSAFEYLYAGDNLVGASNFYTGIVDEPYTREEVDYDGLGQVVRVALGDVTGAPYSSYEYDYVGGVFAGSKFTYTNVPVGASYSSYEVDYDASNALAGTKFFFAKVTGQAYTGEEVDFGANGGLSRVRLTGVQDQAYSSLDLDYSSGVYDGYQAYYTVVGQSFTNEEVDVSASGQLERIVYSGLSQSPYQTVEQDYASGALVDLVYGFTDVTGQTYNAYQVMEGPNGNGLTETFDLNSGGHALIALAAGQTLTGLGLDEMTGAGATTFLLDAIYGADTITNFNAADTVKLPGGEYSQLSAAIGAGNYAGGNATLSFSDGDTLTFENMTQASLTALSSHFTSNS